MANQCEDASRNHSPEEYTIQEKDVEEETSDVAINFPFLQFPHDTAQYSLNSLLSLSENKEKKVQGYFW